MCIMFACSGFSLLPGSVIRDDGYLDAADDDDDGGGNLLPVWEC